MYKSSLSPFLCKGGVNTGMSDGDACNEAGKSIKTCGSNGLCREDYSTWVVDGCANTCN